MKLKKISLMFGSFVIILLSSPVFSMIETRISDKVDKQELNKNWNFEFYNKTGKNLDVLIIGKNYKTEQDLKLPQKKLRISNLDVAGDITISTKEIEPGGYYVEGSDKYYSILPKAGRKQIYVTFKDDMLYPQTGTVLGFSGKTDSGLILNKSKNVQLIEINGNTKMPPSLVEKIKAQIKSAFGVKKR